MEFKSQDKSKVLEFVNHLDDLRVKNLHTDFLILCEGIKIPVHKVILSAGCQYFRDIFESPLPQDTEDGGQKDKQENVVEINGISVVGLESALRYIYAGKFPMTIETDNASLKAVLVVADVLHLPALIEFCRHNLLRNVNVDNCLGLLDVSGNRVQGDCMQKFAGEHYDKLQHTKKFSELQFQEMLSLVTCAKDFQSSDVVFSGIIRWIKQDIDNRKKNLMQLASCFDLKKLSNEYLHFLSKQSVINDHLDTLKVLYQTSTSRLVDEEYTSATNSVDTSSTMSVNDDECYLHTQLDFFVDKNSFQDSRYVYYYSDNLWFKTYSLAETSKHSDFCSVGNFIYFVQRADDDKNCKILFKLHAFSFYVDIVNFPYERYNVFSAVDLRNKIYFRVSTKLVCFNPIDNDWSTIKSDMLDVESKLLTCVECLFCLVFESQSLIRFHPESKLTTVHEIPSEFLIEPRCNYASCNNKIYFHNGENSSFVVYNCVNNEWTSLQLSDGVRQLGANWIFCTIKKELSCLFFVDEFGLVWKFQPKNDSWKRISNADESVKNLIAVVVRN